MSIPSPPETRRSPRKNERKPVYVLNIIIPPNAVDNTLEPAKASMHLKDREVVHELLGDVVSGFLRRNAFLSGTGRAGAGGEESGGTGLPPARKKRRIDFGFGDIEKADVDVRSRPQAATSVTAGRPSSSNGRMQECVVNVVSSSLFLSVYDHDHDLACVSLRIHSPTILKMI